MKYKLFGFLFAPLVVPTIPFLISVSQCIFGGMLQQDCFVRAAIAGFAFALYGVPITWVVMLLLGLPILGVVSRFVRLTILKATLIGALLGGVLMTLLYIPAMAHAPKYFYVFPIYGLILGGAVAGLYWKIASRGYLREKVKMKVK